MGGHDVPQHPSASQPDVRATVPDHDDSVEVANTMEDHSDGESAGSAVDEVPEGEVDVEPQVVRLSPEIRDALISLDSVDLQSVFRRCACVMTSCPAFLVGSYRSAVRLAMTEAELIGECQWDEQRRTRGWKLFLLLPRMFLFRPPRGGLLPKSQLRDRVRQFHKGSWINLLVARSVPNELCKCNAGAVAHSETAWSVGPNGQRLWSRRVAEA